MFECLSWTGNQIEIQFESQLWVVIVYDLEKVYILKQSLPTQCNISGVQSVVPVRKHVPHSNTLATCTLTENVFQSQLAHMVLKRIEFRALLDLHSFLKTFLLF